MISISLMITVVTITLLVKLVSMTFDWAVKEMTANLKAAKVIWRTKGKEIPVPKAVKDAVNKKS